MSRFPGAVTLPSRILPSNEIRPVCLILLFLLTAFVYRVPSGVPVGVPYIETVAIARNLVHEGQFANPFAPFETGSSAHLAPLFPIYMAFCLRIFGDGPAGWHLCAAGATLAVSILLAMLPLVGERLGMGFFTGFVAALLWLAARPNLAMLWEGIYAAVLVAAATFLLRPVMDPASQRSRPVALALGALSGILALTSPVAALPLGILLLVSIARQTKRRRVRYATWILVPAALVVLPWVTRNWMVFHQFIPVRDSFGLELAVSNNDCAVYAIKLNGAANCFQENHPNISREHAILVKQLGEPKYNSRRLHEALEWISTHPKRFLDFSLQRAAAFWFPAEYGSPLVDLRMPDIRALRLIVYGATLLSIPGLLMLRKRDGTSALICLVWLAFYPAVYYVVQYDVRYRLPILWITFLLGVFPLTDWLSRRFGPPAPASTR